ncbi:chalcone isomerase family protein [Iodobacter sp. CM08]|uniref:chalcone isomerase family protein n=1 Tax=Iodobacter sp. CM08 TaxID=3085902 RepID=UPI002982A78D|nr:chalcone isomerase family protein [Iodobacter sp. CM08]MDW5416460.1 chalcone isomerase family protein [Iodobacter sp. CM08]
MRKIALSVLIALASIALPASAATWRDELPQAKALGSGDLTWFRLRIYTAKLWSESPQFSLNAPFALELTYHRSISRTQFVETSIDEIKRLFGKQYSAEQLKRWEGEMYRAFTNVNEGDQLIGVFLPNQGCRFYNRNQLLADIRDPEFAKAFFAIWFDERTKDSGLREQLLGSAK